MDSQYDKKYNLRLPMKVFERIEELCAQYERSVNEQIVYMLKTWQEPASIDKRLTRIENFLYHQEDKRASDE
jgi:hypothetical protein